MPKKGYMVVARQPSVVTDGLTVNGDKHVSFHGKSAKLITDESLVSDIDSQHGLKGDGSVWVERDYSVDSMINYKQEKGHNYFFGPLHVSEEEFNRIFKKGEKPEVDNAHRGKLETKGE